MTICAIRLSLLALVFAASTAAAANKGAEILVTPVTQFEAEAYPGSQFRSQVSAATINSGGTRSAMSLLQPALAFCDARLAKTGAVHVSVSTKEEAQKFANSEPPGTTIDYIDIACPRAYVSAAFTSIDAGDAANAFVFLDKAQALAPYWAGPFTERGFLLNASGDRTQALAAYRHALELAESYPSSQYVAAQALRGIGWALVEQGDYAGARQAYTRSLKLEPGNALAGRELSFIDQYEKSGAAPNTPALATAVPQDERSVAQRQFVMDTKRLELAPTAAESLELRQQMIKWLTETPDVQVVLCDVLDLGNGKDHYEPQLLVQTMFGNAAFQIDHPEQKDDALAVQLASVESALRAYRALIDGHPERRLQAMDKLLQHQNAGDLKQALAAVIEQHCKKKQPAAAPTI